MIQAGAQAPSFTLPDQDGREVSLEDFAGRTLVLYFYPEGGHAGSLKQYVGQDTGRASQIGFSIFARLIES